MTIIKICGITTLNDAFLASGAGAGLLGFIFYPPSPRYLPPEGAAGIIHSIRRQYGKAAPEFVGVFVDAPPDDVSAIFRQCRLDYAQLHGNEPPAEVTGLMDQGIRVIKAFRVRDHTTLEQMEHYKPETFLLDAYTPGNPGGTGQCFNWSLAGQLQAERPIILAGGLTSSNVAQAIRQVHPWAVDVSSGVEASPGRKDNQKLELFIQAVRNSDGGIE